MAVSSLKGGLIEAFSEVVALAGHRFLGIDPNTGRIVGAIAGTVLGSTPGPYTSLMVCLTFSGNVIFNLGGKDNDLGSIGKVILDNIISGKFRRKVRQGFDSHQGYPFCIFSLLFSGGPLRSTSSGSASRSDSETGTGIAWIHARFRVFERRMLAKSHLVRRSRISSPGFFPVL